MPYLRKITAAALAVLISTTVSALTCLAGPAAPPAAGVTVSSPAPAPDLQVAIDAMLARELLPVTNVGMKVISLRDGDTLYEFNPKLLLVPASTQKVFTAAAVLSLLGPERDVATSVLLDAGAGRVYLKGCGDGLLSAADLATLAAQAARKLERGKEYRLSADLSCFDDRYRGKGWMWDDDEPLISPLAVNQSLVTLRVEPGPREGAPVLVRTEPASSFYSVENLAKTGSAKAPAGIETARRPGERDNVITVSGAVPLGSPPLVKHASVWRPELMALGLFRDALRAQGVKVSEAAVAAAPAGAIEAAPAGAKELARLSRRLDDLVRFMLKTSDNLTAESLLKLLGRQATGQPGSGEAGSAEVRRYLEKQGLPVENLVVADGSGLSRYNLTSAETMTQTLRAIYRDRELFRIFQDALPLAGRDGTLQNRLQGSCAEGNLRGKTGNMSGVSALAGYLESAQGEPLAFAIFIQHYAGPGRHARGVQDRIAALLCGFRLTR